MVDDDARADGVEVSDPKTSSVGWPGIAESVKYATAEMGPRRSLQTLLGLNQTDGFDCPSCAWADPEPGRLLHERPREQRGRVRLPAARAPVRNQ